MVDDPAAWYSKQWVKDKSWIYELTEQVCGQASTMTAASDVLESLSVELWLNSVSVSQQLRQETIHLHDDANNRDVYLGLWHC